MKYISFFFLLLFNILSVANPSKTDSLKNLLQYAENKDKLEILHTLTRQYLFKSSDSCIKYGSIAMALAGQQKDHLMKARVCKIMGYSSYRTGDYDPCIDYYKCALENFLKEKQYLDAAILNNFLGDVHIKISDYSKAMSYFISVKKSCDTLINNDSINTSVIKLYSILYTNFGLLYYRLDSIQKPLDYFSKAQKFAIELKDSTRIAASYSNIGMVYKKQKKYAMAKQKYFQALEIAQSIGNKDYEISILNNIANIYKQTGNVDTSLIYYQKAKEIIFEVGDKYNLSLVNRNIAKTYFDQGNNNTALDYILVAVDISNQIGAQEEIYYNYKLLSEIHEKMGKNNLAYEAYKKFTIVKDSVVGQETKEKIADIQIKYETEKQKKENILLVRDIELKELSINQKNNLITIFIVVTSIVLILLLVIFILFRQKSRAYNAIVKQNLKSLELENKLAKSIANMPNQTTGKNQDQNDKYAKLKLQLEKFIIEEKPYLWADVNMEEFCKKLNTNRTYLSKLINDQYNHSFNDFLCEYRIREARNLLADSSKNNLSVEGIGETAGFKTNSHFHKKFKDQVGITPKQFREKVLKRNLY